MLPAPIPRSILPIAIFLVNLPALAQDSELLPEGARPDFAAVAGDGVANGAGNEEVAEGIFLEDGSAGFSLFPDLKVDVSGSGSLIHDSNTTQTPDGPSASLFSFAYGANVKSREESERGGYFGFDLKGQYYVYDDAASAMGRDPYEQYLTSFLGVNGALTRIRLDIDYHRNNGNTIAWDHIQRETRRAGSHDYNVNLHVSRVFHRGSLEFGTGYNLRDFDGGSGYNDGETTYGDVAWMTTPSFAPKSEMGLGLRFGTDEFQGQSQQDFVTPSYRWRYRLSGKTTVRNNLGYEIRSSDAPGGRESGHFVFDGGVDWAATARTGIGLGYYRRVQPSYVLNGEDATTTGFSLNMVNKLPSRFVLETRLGYENASYFPNAGGVASGRDDDFIRLAFELRHPLMITENLLGEWAVFYHHNQNDSTVAPFAFDQDIAGLRVGLVY